MNYFLVKSVFVLVLTTSISSLLHSQDVPEWRGVGRTGVFEAPGSMTTWPDGGPALLWVCETIPNGYSSISIANGLIYLTGIVDDMDVLVAVDQQGVVKWQVPYGRAWGDSYNPSRATPTLDGGKAYMSSGLGDVACVDALSGKIQWQLQASEKYQGTYGKWGISESLLIVEDQVFFTPGGSITTMVALDKETGEEHWVSGSLEDKPSFTSPLLVDWNNKKSVVSLTENYAFAVDPASGDIRWTFDFGSYAGGESKRNNQTNTPLFENGKLFLTSGYDHKCVQLRLSDDHDAVTIAWVDSTLDVHHGGVVKVGDYLYGASWEGNRDGNWVCLSWNTGKPLYEVTWENKGSIVAANDMLYCYEEKNGNIALVPASPAGFEITGTFQVPYGTGPHWSHPVISDGKLYIRHGTALMVYSVLDLP